MIAWTLSAMALIACTTGRYECDEQNPCALGATCVNGTCEEARCATSAQCPMEHTCSARRECEPGCGTDRDCYPGDHCDTLTNTCVPDGCTDTRVDCGYREFCNQGTGECYDAGDRYCKFCNEDFECGEGNLCLGHYCGVDCSQGQACPSGFECYPWTNNAGEVIAQQCFTYCWLYDPDYEPGADTQRPPGSLPITPPACVDDFGVSPIGASESQ